MTIKTFAAGFTLPLLIAGLFAQSSPQPVQEKDSGASLKRFVGTWKGFCADGKEFVVLILNQAGSDIGGTISLGKFEGPEGQCTSVVDLPAEAHAMKITDAQLRGGVLAFKGRGGVEFEMTVRSDEGAQLKFLGTPVEENPWVLKKSN
jgi:hypothetical protein